MFCTVGVQNYIIYKYGEIKNENDMGTSKIKLIRKRNKRGVHKQA